MQEHEKIITNDSPHLYGLVIRLADGVFCALCASGMTLYWKRVEGPPNVEGEPTVFSRPVYSCSNRECEQSRYYYSPVITAWRRVAGLHK